MGAPRVLPSQAPVGGAVLPGAPLQARPQLKELSLGPDFIFSSACGSDCRTQCFCKTATHPAAPVRLSAVRSGPAGPAVFHVPGLRG